jgi:hypothetical protein
VPATHLSLQLVQLVLIPPAFPFSWKANRLPVKLFPTSRQVGKDNGKKSGAKYGSQQEIEASWLSYILPKIFCLS